MFAGECNRMKRANVDRQSCEYEKELFEKMLNQSHITQGNLCHELDGIAMITVKLAIQNKV